MVEITTLVSTALTGLAVVGAGIVLSRVGGRRHYDVGIGEREASGGVLGALGRRVAAVGRMESTWIIGFLALVVLATAGVAVFFSQPSAQAALVLLLAAGLTVVVFGYLVVGVYRTLLERGRPRAEAVGIAAWALGALFLVAVAANLLVG